MYTDREVVVSNWYHNPQREHWGSIGNKAEAIQRLHPDQQDEHREIADEQQREVMQQSGVTESWMPPPSPNGHMEGLQFRFLKRTGTLLPHVQTVLDGWGEKEPIMHEGKPGFLLKSDRESMGIIVQGEDGESQIGIVKSPIHRPFTDLRHLNVVAAFPVPEGEGVIPQHVIYQTH